MSSHVIRNKFLSFLSDGNVRLMLENTDRWDNEVILLLVCSLLPFLKVFAQLGHPNRLGSLLISS